jgi:hypothetical protein
MMWTAGRARMGAWARGAAGGTETQTDGEGGVEGRFCEAGVILIGLDVSRSMADGWRRSSIMPNVYHEGMI